MSISNGDIIRDALDIFTSERAECQVVVLTRGGDPVRWYATLTGLSSQGDDATITVSNIRASLLPGSPVVPGHILLNVSDVLELSKIGES